MRSEGTTPDRHLRAPTLTATSLARRYLRSRSCRTNRRWCRRRSGRQSSAPDACHDCDTRCRSCRPQNRTQARSSSTSREGNPPQTMHRSPRECLGHPGVMVQVYIGRRGALEGTAASESKSSASTAWGKVSLFSAHDLTQVVRARDVLEEA